MKIDIDKLFYALKKADILKNIESKNSDEPIEWETAYHLCDIVNTLEELNENIISFINCSSNEYLDKLEEIRSNVRHIAYHIKESMFFSAVLDQV